jgi:hypothetical protein
LPRGNFGRTESRWSAADYRDVKIFSVACATVTTGSFHKKKWPKFGIF